MARLAERQPVIDVEPEVWMEGERLHMMRRQVTTNYPAPLAHIVVASEHRHAPPLVLDRVVPRLVSAADAALPRFMLLASRHCMRIDLAPRRRSALELRLSAR